MNDSVRFSLQNLKKSKIDKFMYVLAVNYAQIKPASLMMEEPKRRVRKHHLVLVSSFDTLFIHHAPTGRSEVPHPALPRPMYIIREREKRIARARHPIQPRRPLPLLRLAQRLRHLRKLPLPLRALAALQHLPAHEQIDRIRLLGALDPLFERQREHARVVPQPPDVRLGARQPRAVDARLLPGAQADDGPIFGVRDAVGLRILDREGRDDEVRQCLLRELGGVL